MKTMGEDAQDNKKKPTVCGVRVATWDAQTGKHNPLKNIIDAELFGGNVGHAAISLTLPVNETNENLLKQYCSHPYIPVEKHLVRVPAAKQNAQGQWVIDEKAEPIFQEEVYMVTFSWWPGIGGFELSSSINSDGANERTGVHKEWDTRFSDFVEEKRVHKGKIGATKMTYGAAFITHERNLNYNQRKYLNLTSEASILENKIQAIKLAIEKMDEKETAFSTLRQRQAVLREKEDIAFLQKVTQEYKNNNQILLAPAETQRLKDFFAVLECTIEKSEEDDLNALTGLDPTLLENRCIELRKALEKNPFPNDTQEAILADKAKIEDHIKLSETDIILLDRFVPEWKTTLNTPLTQENYSTIIETLLKTKKEDQKNLVKIRDNISKLNYVNDPIVTHEITEKIKPLNNRLGEIGDELQYINLQKYQFSLKMEELLSVHDYLKKSYFDDDDDSEDDEITIEGALKENLDNFSNCTNIDWKNFIASEDKTTIDMDELKEIYDTIDLYFKKNDVLNMLKEHLDSDNTVIKDPAAKKILQQVYPFVGKGWKEYVAASEHINTPAFQITQEDIQNLIQVVQSQELDIEKALPDHIKNMDANIEKWQTEYEKIKLEKEQLLRTQSVHMEDYKKYEALEKNKDKLNNEYISLKNKIKTAEKNQDLPKIESLKQDLVELEKNIKENNDKLISALPRRDCFNAQDFESFLTIGLPPEVEYRLSLDKESDPNQGIQWGMNAQGMFRANAQYINARGAI